MAKKTTKTTKKGRDGKRAGGAKRALIVAAVLFACLAVFAGYMAVKANVVHVRYATVWLEDLPRSFDGTRILFVSDPDVTGLRSPAHTARLLTRLSALQPDMLLLGGDFANPSLPDRLNGRGADDPTVAERMISARQTVLEAVRDFPAPLGKYAVAGENDTVGDFAADLAAVGVRDLTGDVETLYKKGNAIYLCGVKNAQTPTTVKVGREDFVLVLTHSPENVPSVLTAEAQDGGHWADLILAGHTHGGQIRLFDRTLFSLTEHEKDYLSGWKRVGDGFLLISSGVGCEAVNLRLGTEAEVHLITLRTKEATDGIRLQ